MMEGLTFDRIDLGGLRQAGLKASQVRLALEPLVVEVEGGFLSVAYGNMAALFVEAIKVLEDRIIELELKNGS
jgi:hypothetical protein